MAAIRPNTRLLTPSNSVSTCKLAAHLCLMAMTLKLRTFCVAVDHAWSATIRTALMTATINALHPPEDLRLDCSHKCVLDFY